MKEIKSIDDVATKSLPILSSDEGASPIGYLTPLSSIHVGDRRLAKRLAKWRDANQFAYPTRFSVSTEGTLHWLENAVVNNRQRLLFLVLDTQLYPVGHLGLAYQFDGSLEVDNVLRGESQEPGLMSMAMNALESWAVHELDTQFLTLRVLKSNEHAVSFYQKLGYTQSESTPLTWVDRDMIRELVPSEGQEDDAFLTMWKDLEKVQPARNHILTAGPLIGVREATYSLEATRHGWNAKSAGFLTQFENEFASYVNRKYAIATSSCTGALHLSLLALGIGPGDEVIVPETTWVATASAVAYTGATPVFADVDPETWTITPDTVEPLINEKTCAIMPVHLYGFAADMVGLARLAAQHQLRVIEDAAPAIGTLIEGLPAGSFGDFGCFSFQGAKMLVTGEGGMLTTDNKDLFDLAWEQQDHGRVPGSFWIAKLGRKYKMSNQTAALGLAQLESSETQIRKKRRINGWYRELLAGEPNIRFQNELPGSRSICWMTSIEVLSESGLNASQLSDLLRQEGIDSRPVFPPISSYPIWGNENRSATPGPVASSLAKSALNLPSGVRLSRASVERVCRAIRQAMSP